MPKLLFEFPYADAAANQMLTGLCLPGRYGSCDIHGLQAEIRFDSRVKMSENWGQKAIKFVCMSRRRRYNSPIKDQISKIEIKASPVRRRSGFDA